MPNYNNQYLTLVAKESGQFQFYITSVNSEYYYSTDEGQTWNTATSATTISVSNGSRVMYKGTLIPNSSNYEGIGRFYITTQFEAEGNPMSLLFGDNFIGQTSLSGKDYVFNQLFLWGNLTSIQNLKLPATTLSIGCYYSMFARCTSLTTIPEDLLLATTLTSNCYGYMFNGCTSLTTSPILPATTLPIGCYFDMFNGCTSLSAITCLATDITAAYSTTNWVDGVANSGTFYKASGMTDWTRSTSGIPINWTVEDYNPQPIEPIYRWTATTGYECSGTTKMSREKEQVSTDGGQTWTDVSPAQYRAALPVIEYNSTDCGYVPPITIEKWETIPYVSGDPSTYLCEECGGSIERLDYQKQYLTIVIHGNGSFRFGKANYNQTYYYSVDDGVNWLSGNGSTVLTVINGERILFKGTMTPMNGIGTFSASTDVYLEPIGNPMSLLFGDNFSGQTNLEGKDYAFAYLFSGSSVINAQEMVLPATELSVGCYMYMFSDCYDLMTTVEELPATMLETNCYKGMFNMCKNLAYAPKDLLPSTTLAEGCYDAMFYGCQRLLEAPDLLAKSLQNSCYQMMFNYCTRLKEVTCLAINVSAQDCTYAWLDGVPSSGTFYKNPNMNSWTRDENGIPSGWTITNYVN